MKPTQELHDLGQSLWLDNITRTMLEHRAGDVVQPEALAEIVELLRGLHSMTSLAASTTLSGVKPNFDIASLSGAEVPNVFIPIVRPFSPT